MNNPNAVGSIPEASKGKNYETRFFSSVMG
jgi:hypothetical protein